MNRNINKNTVILNDNIKKDSSNLLKLKENYFDLTQKTLVMDILNVTPDSFYDGGIYKTVDDYLYRIEEMLSEGADIIDIGAESTRPGSGNVDEQEELDRILPVLEKALPRFETVFSVDTTKSVVACEALGLGVSVINDISGLNFDEKIAEEVAKHEAAIVLMHTPGHPGEMQTIISYNALIEDIISYLESSVGKALGSGIEFESIIIDPGIGFGKTVEHNLEIIRNLSDFSVLGRPVMIGTSRKSFIGKLLGDLSVDNRLEGTAATVAVSIMNGASIVRVHDVHQMKLVARMTDAIYNKN
ncbi:MAG: dihydropteroate synthase [Thermodesulfobacteriota bacterium]